MRLWHILRARLRSLLFRAGRESELREELRLHIERETERHIARGLDSAAARRLAHREFGGVEALKEECRDARGTATLDTLGRDIRYAARRLTRDWRFSAAAVLILALGIGANTAIFSLVNAALFRGSPFANPDSLVEIYQNQRNGSPDLSPYPVYQDIAAYTEVFASVTAVSFPDGVSYLDGRTVRAAAVEYTTASYPHALGVHPSLGRWFDAADEAPGAPLTVVISHHTWTRRFAADPSVIGRTITIEGVGATIVGVGSANVSSTVNAGVATDFWLPIQAMTVTGRPASALERSRLESYLFVKARLRDGVTVAQARSAMQNLGRRLATEYPDESPGKGFTVLAASEVLIHPEMDALIAVVATVVLLTVGLVLAIACSNLATLLLIRGVARAKEVSVRLALGATRRQIIRHLLAESLLLALAGGAAGCLLAWWATTYVSMLDLPIGLRIALDYRVLGYALVLSIVTGLGFGLTPALRATGVDLLPMLRRDGDLPAGEHRRFSLKNALVVFQVAVSVVLLAATSVFLQLIAEAGAQPTGFAVAGVAILRTDARFAGYSAADSARVAEVIRRRVEAIPGVQSAVLTRGRPMAAVAVPIVIEGNGGATSVANAIWSGTGYFEALQIPILHGRALNDLDRPATPHVAVISERMARRFFDTPDAVGRRFRIDQPGQPWIEVVGVARDSGTADRVGDFVDPSPYLFYRSASQWSQPPDAILARTSLDAADLAVAMQRELRAVDASLPVISAHTMAHALHETMVVARSVATFFGTLGTLGLLLAGIGLYAVVAFSVSRRTREIGIRIAIGAGNRQVIRDVVRDTAGVIGVGSTIGVALSLLAIAGMRQVSLSVPGRVFTPEIDLAALAMIVGFIALVGIAAACVPAWRATRIDPMQAFRDL
jgi:macrolide transport system ATP-binding/permease protein